MVHQKITTNSPFVQTPTRLDHPPEEELLLREEGVVTTATNKPITQAAGISRYINNWFKITNNNFILNIVEFGYKLQFLPNPSFPQSVISHYKSHDKIVSLRQQIERHVLSGAISIVEPQPNQILSRVFTVKKSNGEDRMIIDLSLLNLQIKKISFKMETIHDIMKILHPSDYLVSIDLTEAFFALSINNDSKRFLCFKFEEKIYNYNILPFGLTSSPRIFSKMLKVPIVHLRSLGINISFYLDDIIITAPSCSLLKTHLDLTLNLLISLGFTPNYDKSNLIPSRTINHLGFDWNTHSMILSVPKEKVIKTKLLATKLLSSPITLRELSSFIGLTNSLCPAFSLSPVHFRSLQFLLCKYIHRDYSWDSPIVLDKASIEDLNWWKSCDSSLPGANIHTPAHDLTMSTDASNSGWGGVLSSGESISGQWSDSDSLKHINFLELKAVKLTVISLLPHIRNKNLLLYSDNFTTVSYVNKKGGTRSRPLCLLALEIWELFSSNNISCSAIHIPGVDNCEADFYSRTFSYSNEYSLNSNAFKAILSIISFTPTIDLFASTDNRKLKSFIAWNYDPQASGTNAFSFKWKSNIYLFPPINLITKCLHKIISDNVHNALLITPAWPGLMCISTIYSLMFNNPIYIPRESLEGPLPTRRPFPMMAWSISSHLVPREEYQRRLAHRLSKASLQPQSLLTQEHGENLLRSLQRQGHTVELL